MSTEEVFVVNFTLLEYNLNYDELDNPKAAMIDALNNYYDNNIIEKVRMQILDIPNKLMKEQIVDFLFDSFLKHDKTDPGDAYSYKTLDKRETHYYFFNDPDFSKYLIFSYYKYCTNNKIKNPEVEKTTNKKAENLQIIDINERLHQDINNIVVDFLRAKIPLSDTLSIIKNIVIDGYTFHPDQNIKCSDELYEIYFYRNYLYNLMISEIYEDILYGESIMGDKLESPIFKIGPSYDEEDFDYEFDKEEAEIMGDYEEDEEDADYEEFNELIKLLVNNKGLNIYLPDDFYEELVSNYFYIISDEERLQANRENMKANHQKVLKRINPLYIFDQI